jgi:hypothetical protein
MYGLGVSSGLIVGVSPRGAGGLLLLVEAAGGFKVEWLAGFVRTAKELTTAEVSSRIA